MGTTVGAPCSGPWLVEHMEPRTAGTRLALTCSLIIYLLSVRGIEGVVSHCLLLEVYRLPICCIALTWEMRARVVDLMTKGRDEQCACGAACWYHLSGNLT